MADVEHFIAGDGYRWAYRRWRPAGAVVAHVVFLHGIQSHGGWYEGTASWLCERGVAVDFLDRRGSGLNDAERGHARLFRRLLDDIGEFLGAQPRSPGVPRVLAGISWGGKLAAALPFRHPGLIDGLALFCPGLAPKVQPPLLSRISIAACGLVKPRQPFAVPLSDPALFTASKDWQKFIADDPHAVRHATARFLSVSTLLDIYLKRAGRGVTIPVLLMLAGQDRIIANKRVRRQAATWPAPRLTVIEYAGAQHTLEFEPDPDRHRHDFRQWLGTLTA